MLELRPLNTEFFKSPKIVDHLVGDVYNRGLIEVEDIQVFKTALHVIGDRFAVEDEKVVEKEITDWDISEIVPVLRLLKKFRNNPNIDGPDFILGFQNAQKEILGNMGNRSSLRLFDGVEKIIMKKGLELDTLAELLDTVNRSKIIDPLKGGVLKDFADVYEYTATYYIQEQKEFDSRRFRDLGLFALESLLNLKSVDSTTVISILNGLRDVPVRGSNTLKSIVDIVLRSDLDDQNQELLLDFVLQNNTLEQKFDEEGLQVYVRSKAKVKRFFDTLSIKRYEFSNSTTARLEALGYLDVKVLLNGYNEFLKSNRRFIEYPVGSGIFILRMSDKFKLYNSIPLSNVNLASTVDQMLFDFPTASEFMTVLSSVLAKVEGKSMFRLELSKVLNNKILPKFGKVNVSEKEFNSIMYLMNTIQKNQSLSLERDYSHGAVDYIETLDNFKSIVRKIYILAHGGMNEVLKNPKFPIQISETK